MTFPYRIAVCCGAAALLLAGAAAAVAVKPADKDKEPAKAEKMWAYVGTYTDKEGSKGIYRYEFDPETGELSGGGLVAESVNPTFLAADPGNHYLYAVNEVADFGGKKAGAVSGYRINRKTGDLKFLNQKSSVGTGPCHLVVDHRGQYVLVANYGGGSTTVLPIEEYGILGDASDFVQHKGTGGDPKRQEGPHAHCAVVDPANRFALVADLGLDKVLVYRLDETKGTITPNDPPSASLAPASGPRHIAFAPDGKHVYVINEMDSTVTALDYDADKGVLKKLQTLSTLPKDFKGENSTAEVVVHPSGKFLYGSNRGHNSIVIYGIDAKTGELTLIDDQVGDIKTPRNFAVDPSGKYLIVANQDGGSLFVYAIDPKTGRLTRTKQTVEVSKPVCVVFVPKVV